MQKVLGTGRDNKRHSKQPWEIIRDSQELRGTGRGSERQPPTVGDSERHAATIWYWKRQ